MVMVSFKNLFFLASTLLMANLTEASDLAAIRSKRQDSKALMNTINGAYQFLDQTQIRNRPGRYSCLIDSSDGDGCYPKKIKNIRGEWASQLYSFPMTRDPADLEKTPLIQDSTMFVTSGVAYPLFFLKGANLEMTKKMALLNIMRFKKDGEYNFWIKHPGITSDMTVVGPLNVSFRLLNFIDAAEKVFKKILGPITSNKPKKKRWDDRVKDKNENPWGKDSYFNIPNDADDTALAVSIQALMKNLVSAETEVDEAALLKTSEFRDIDRLMHDQRDTWTPKNSGGFLTWLKDETLPTFGSPETGVMPIGVNNVDCVVNANVLMAAGLAGVKDMPGLSEADHLLATMIKNKTWIDRCAFYYPQRMMFAYTVTRAFRDTNVLSGATSETRLQFQSLVKQILKLQEKNGAFPGGYDNSKTLATALATVALLNLGERSAGDNVLEYRLAIKNAVRWLIADGVYANLGHEKPAIKWEAGIFFAASTWSIAQWRSEAYSTAIVLEALSKFALAYDLSEGGILDHEKLMLH